MSGRAEPTVVASQPEEEHFIRRVIELAEGAGWSAFRTWSRTRSGPPDLILVDPDGRIEVAKVRRGELEDHELRWLEAFNACGCTRVHVWKPGNYAPVLTVLRRLR